jgi:recombinational DNA repair protein RecT
VIKNKRGEFLTILGKEELEKHRKTAKTDFIWKQWFREMCLKTIMKKACKLHFGDIFTAIEEQDNENYDLENPLDLDLKWKQEIDAIKTKAELKAYYEKNK